MSDESITSDVGGRIHADIDHHLRSIAIQSQHPIDRFIDIRRRAAKETFRRFRAIRADENAVADRLCEVKRIACFRSGVAHEFVDSDDSGEPQTLSHPCPCCGGRMIIIETFERGGEPRYRPTVPIRIDSS